MLRHHNLIGVRTLASLIGKFHCIDDIWATQLLLMLVLMTFEFVIEVIFLDLRGGSVIGNFVIVNNL
jgi:hypothetical protein